MTYAPEVNSCTMQRGVAWFSSGGLLLALEGAEHFFGLIQSFDFLKTKAPAIYAVAINPTVQAAVLFCGILLILIGIKKAREPEKMMPPAAILGDHNQIVSDNRETRVAGRDMYIVNDVPITPTPVTPRRREPNLIDRGVTERLVHLPAFNENRNEWSDLEFTCFALGIRNDAESAQGSARNVVAHLEFESDIHPRIIIENGWWIGDGDAGSVTLWIERSQTKYLVLACLREGDCFPVGKQWARELRRNVPEANVLFQPGDWRLTIEIAAEFFRARYYTDGTVREDGTMQWNQTVAQRPTGWPR